MRKIYFMLLLAIVSLTASAQKGDLSVGLKGGYISYYKDGLYGMDLSYHLTDPFEVAFTGIFNPKTSLKNDITNKVNDFAIYSANLDLRMYLLAQRTWAMGPALGGQYLIVNSSTDNLLDTKVLGFNMGWHIRANVTDNIKANGGWRYTNAKEDLSHHYFYLGVAYTFQTY
ncbi:MAG: porin family protein [Dysgonamonadaceae bacterium]|jgi:opacity protein-like surface antigen|nr:porin family protein [Dysgonamonadaceae bacterium]